jgi:hypothetical protein
MDSDIVPHLIASLGVAGPLFVYLIGWEQAGCTQCPAARIRQELSLLPPPGNRQAAWR